MGDCGQAGRVSGELIYVQRERRFIKAERCSSAPRRFVATKKLNALIRAYVKQAPRVKYIETYTMSLGPDGQPRRDLFIADKLHFNSEGNKLLAARVRPFLKK